MPIAVRAALEGDGALLARLIRESSALDDLGSPRDFSIARYATVCETEPLPWDPGTPIEARPAVIQQRIAALPPDTFAPFDPPVVVEDEIDLCLRWPDVPRPPSTPRRAVPDRADADPPGRRGPAHAAGGARPGSRSGSRARCGSSSPASGTRPSATRAPARAGDPALRPRHAAAEVPCKRIPTGVPAVPRRPRPSSRCAARAGSRARSGGRSARCGATFDDLHLVLSPATLTTSGGGLRGGSWEVRGGRLVLRDYRGRRRGHRRRGGGDRTRSLTLRVAGTKAATGTVTLRSRRAIGPGRSASEVASRLDVRARATSVPRLARSRWRADSSGSARPARRVLVSRPRRA